MFINVKQLLIVLQLVIKNPKLLSINAIIVKLDFTILTQQPMVLIKLYVTKRILNMILIATLMILLINNVKFV